MYLTYFYKYLRSEKTIVRHRGYIYGKEKIRHVCTSVEVARDIKSNIFNPRHSE